MATVTDVWFSGGGLAVSVTYNNANGNVSRVSVTNSSGAPITGNVQLNATGQTFTHTFPVGTSQWNVPAGFQWAFDSPTFPDFTAWWG